MDKKVLCLIDCLNSGGAQRQMVGLAGLLKQNGYSVRLVTYYDIPFYKPLLKSQGVEYEYLEKANNKWFRIYAIYQYLTAYSPDAVIAYLDGPSIIACICKMRGGKFRLIVSERNTTQRLSWKERIKFWSYRFADKIVCNSYTQARFVENHYPLLSPRCEVITNYVDLERFQPLPREAFEHPYLHIVGVGRVSEQKNILRFIEAVNIVRQHYPVKVSWYGMKDSYFAWCEKKIEEYRLNDIFTFYAPTQEVERVYHEADLFCLPSIYEGFPNVLCEAMSCGVPVVCSRVCDNPYIVEEGKSGFLFDPNDVQDMVRTIERFIELPDNQRRELAANARLRVEQLCSKETFVNSYRRIIDA